MAKNDDKARVLIALTESSPIDALWDAAIARLERSRADLMALFLAEDHWHRAASLPFTREISRLSGADADFTLLRARQVQEESIERARRMIRKLGADAKLSPAFEVLTEQDRKKISKLVSGAGDILIAPSFIIRLPLYAELEKLDCRIELIEVSRDAGATATAASRGRTSARPSIYYEIGPKPGNVLD